MAQAPRAVSRPGPRLMQPPCLKPGGAAHGAVAGAEPVQVTCLFRRLWLPRVLGEPCGQGAPLGWASSHRLSYVPIRHMGLRGDPCSQTVVVVCGHGSYLLSREEFGGRNARE